MVGIKGRSGGAREGSGRKPKTVRVPADKAFGFWHGLDEYEQEFFAKACQYASIEPTRANILKLAKEASQEGINQAMQRVFERYKQEHSEEEQG
jgi:hypothetical protein